MSLPIAICIMGPTASGKTSLAVDLVQRYPMDIISVDSALVYRGMDIGSAKPDAKTLALAPHRLIDIRDPQETYSASDFRHDALREMRDISGAGRIPLLVGGTMLYFRALLEGLSDLPPADEAVRRSIEERAQQRGWPSLHAELTQRDPAAAGRIDPNDSQRIQRALEVLAITGTPLSELQQRSTSPPLGYRLLKIIVSPADRGVLHQRIAERYEIMMNAGFEQEVRGLRSRPELTADLPAMRAVGYRQLWQWMDAGEPPEGPREKVLAATRQLAKRQLTWLRRESDALWYDPTEDSAPRGVTRVIGKFLESPGGRSHFS